MLLTIDVGNTETKLGCFTQAGELTHTWRVATDVKRTPDEYGVFFMQLFASGAVDHTAVEAVAIASVVPKVDAALDAVCRQTFRIAPAFLRAQEQRLLPVLTEHPAESGADLIAAAIGGRARFGSPLIVVSYGTATVFVAISPAGEYLGVAIAPGITISIDALIGRTAKLPQVALEAPASTIGRTTDEALRSGIVYGFAGQTQAIVERMRGEIGAPAKVVATGGLAELFARHTAVVDAVDPHLSLFGLRLFHESVGG